MRRRTFIYISVATVAATGIAVFYKWNTGTKSKRQPLMFPLVLSSFCDEPMLRSMGDSYLAAHSNENSKEKLLKLITGGLKINQQSANDNIEIINELELKVEQEFKTEKTTILKGWVVTEAEARQCALLSLS